MQKVSEGLWTPTWLWDSRRQNETLVSMSNHLSGIVYKWLDNTEDCFTNAPPQPDVKSGSVHRCFVADPLRYRDRGVPAEMEGAAPADWVSHTACRDCNSCSNLMILVSIETHAETVRTKGRVKVSWAQVETVAGIRHNTSQSGSYHERRLGVTAL